MGLFVLFCISLLMLAMSTVVNGIVVSFMWNWFFVPLGAPAIGFWLAVGIALTVSIFNARYSDAGTGGGTDTDTDIKLMRSLDELKKLLRLCTVKIMVLGLGAVVEVFI